MLELKTKTRKVVMISPLEELQNMKKLSPSLQLIRTNGAQCVCCGAKGTKLVTFCTLGKQDRIMWHNVVTEDNMLLTVDHVVPRDKGGPDIYSNKQVLCQACNQYKSNHDISIKELRFRLLTLRSGREELPLGLAQKQLASNILHKSLLMRLSIFLNRLSKKVFEIA